MRPTFATNRATNEASISAIRIYQMKMAIDIVNLEDVLDTLASIIRKILRQAIPMTRSITP